MVAGIEVLAAPAVILGCGAYELANKVKEINSRERNSYTKNYVSS